MYAMKRDRDGCSGFCRAFALPAPAFFSRVLVGINLLRFPCGSHRAALPIRRLVAACLVLSQRDAGDIVEAEASTRTAGTFLRATPGMLPPGSASLPDVAA